MLGRSAYHHSYLLAQLDAILFPSAEGIPSREQVLRKMLGYAHEMHGRGTPLRAITRHLLGLYHGQPSARFVRRVLSDSTLLATNDITTVSRALAAYLEPSSNAD